MAMGPRTMSNSEASSHSSNSRPRLQHRKSAKELIDEYEDTMRAEPRPQSYPRGRRASPSAALLSVAPARGATATTTASASFYPAGSRKGGTGTLPLRHSFKNLLSLLKKGKTGLIGSDKDKAIFPTTAKSLRTSAAALLEDQRVKELPLLPLPLGHAERPALSRSQTEMGALIYLTGSAFDSNTPVWIASTIVLQGSKLSVSWFTPDGVACAHEISLLGCSDIRSVSDLRSLGSKEREALPTTEGEDLKVFELLFKNRRPTERFAVNSVRERAKWISAFWNAILPSPGEDTALGFDEGRPQAEPMDFKKRHDVRPADLHITASSSSYSPTKAEYRRPLPSRTNTDRSLPPTPITRTLSRPATSEKLSPRVPPISIPSNPIMSRTSTNMTSNTLLLPPPPRLPMPISPASAYSTASALPSPTRSSSTRSPPPPSPQRWLSLDREGGGNGSSGASSVASGASLVRRANSPSITNLSRLSMVKERLAQLERAESLNSSSVHPPPLRKGSSRGGFGSRSAYSSLNDVGGGDNHLDRRSGGSDDSKPGNKKGSDPDEGVPTGAQPKSQEEKGKGKQKEADTSQLATAFSSNTAQFNSLLNHVKATDGLPISATTTTSPPGKRTTGERRDYNQGLLSLNPDSERIFDGIARIQSVLGGNQSHRAAGPDGGSATIHQVALGLDDRLKGANETLKEVKSTLRGIEKHLEKANSKSAAAHTDPSDNAARGISGQNEEVLKVLQGVKAQLDANLPALEARISEIGKHKAVEQRDVPASGPAASLDLGPVQKQLDNLIKLSSSTQAIMNSGTVNKGLLSEITHLTSLMEADRAHREQQLLQQADSVRYLNELNTWLGAFVNNGASHIQGLAASIDKLCADLGSTPLASSQINSTGGGTSTSSLPSLLNDVRQLILGMKARDQNMALLQAAVNDLIVAVSSETRAGVDSQALAHLMASQQRNQESVLKVFTDEISDEIKGERLRFVEAMKEATAINVQLHVEELKKEMGKEVFVMAKEVERLHRDKQKVEQRIADLMAFYSNQATPISADTGGRAPHHYQQQHQHSMKPVADLRMKPLASGQPTSRSHRRQTYSQAQARPLPLPRGTY